MIACKQSIKFFPPPLYIILNIHQQQLQYTSMTMSRQPLLFTTESTQITQYQVSLLVHCKYIRAYPVGTVHDRRHCCLMDGLVCESALARNTLQVPAPPCVSLCLCVSVRVCSSVCVCVCLCVCTRTKHFASVCTAH